MDQIDHKPAAQPAAQERNSRACAPLQRPQAHRHPQGRDLRPPMALTRVPPPPTPTTPAPTGSRAVSLVKDSPPSMSTPHADVAMVGADIEKATHSSARDLHARLRSGVVAAVRELRELRFVRERPSCLLDHIAYARSGEWITEEKGRARDLALLWAYLIAIPVSIVAYLAVWAVARPLRCACVTASGAVLATALNDIPVIGWFIPDWMSLTAWPPFIWF